MEFTGVEHAELFVGDAVLSSYFFCHALGFRMVASGGPETGLPGRRSFVLEQGAARLIVTSALNADNEVAAYVRAHGDGVRDIALGTPDAHAAFTEAVRRGAKAVAEPVTSESHGQRVVRATIAGPGDWVHSFIQRDAPASSFPPSGYLPVEAGPSGGASLFTAVDHFAFALRPHTLMDTVGFYESVLGFEQTHREDVRTEYSGMSSRVVQSVGGRVCFPLQEPVSGTRRGQLEDFIGAHGGAGVQHIAFLSNDIARAVDALRQHGVSLLDAPQGYYEGLEARLGTLSPFEREPLQARNILMDRDAWGALLQVFTRSQHARRTLFFEVIQRHQARGFGGANIQALYAAKEQEAVRAAS
ncbi:4-hydroxyphenylpyruvate dioxygenase [Myxococcus stipitatus]|uniref:4-hydroxyphenylpyruvate dioxygenase n=1 Tax=Myxococcus stipitatus TaxID=83455 RepID=UPI003145239D